MADILILGGTRDIGHFAALELLTAGHNVAVLNRGRTADELPASVERLRADRCHTEEMRRVLGRREFDLVLDTTTYDAADARDAVESFDGRVGHYVFISTGQVYLVRAGLERPFRESDYDGPLMAEPEPGTSDHDSWRYGVEKRAAEEVFGDAWVRSRFPVTTLRLPIVASERDPAGRVQAYIARILDRGPILIPAESGARLRHVYVADVARLVTRLVQREEGIGHAINISFGESMTLKDFIALLASAMGERSQVVGVERSRLEAKALLPDCSPFTSRWMSELDNARSVELFTRVGLTYTAPPDYVANLVNDYRQRWHVSGIHPTGYEQRAREIAMAAALSSR